MAAGGAPSVGLSGSEKVKVAALFAVIVAVTVFGFVASFEIGRVAIVLAGLGLVSYVLGLRHAVDADHIAAIDNTTRKLLQENKRPLTVGTWFSLGHSTVVVGLILLFVFAAREIGSSLPALRADGSVVGTLVSGSFLWIIGLVNVVIVVGIYRVFKSMKEGKLDRAELDGLMEKRGFMNRFFHGLFNVVNEPWQTYPVGVLFGLGFDTASEVALVAISVGAGVSANIPLYYILVLPLMFTCGMVLIDTADGVVMRMAYGWAFLNPLRKVYYNLTVTVISVLVAWMIGSVELLQVLSAELNLGGGFWLWLDRLDFETLGYAIVAVFVASWAISMSYWKVKRFEERYAGVMPTERPA
ncbi:MAG TPA: HoxN/HupN/NixA family nickel/cobalt transporter [Nitrososphaerales archaeon]|nr:HoxN/HupN/NixA family nickel/cobalt transporter [Nitrososphaerales archaeon]